MTDEELVGQVQKGRVDEYEELVKRYEKGLFRYIKRVTSLETEEVEDLVQDTLISSFENLLGFDLKLKFSSWLYRIAHNKCIDMFRKNKLKTTTTNDKEELIESKNKLIEELEIEKERNEILGEAINKLDLKYREVVWLYYFEDKSYEEISDILRTNTSNVGVLLSRAKDKLKKIITQPTLRQAQGPPSLDREG